MIWITYIAPYSETYTSRALYKDCTKDIPKMYVFNCHLNESIVGISLMLSGRLFQAVGPAHKKPGCRIWCKMIVLAQPV